MPPPNSTTHGVTASLLVVVVTKVRMSIADNSVSTGGNSKADKNKNALNFGGDNIFPQAGQLVATGFSGNC